MKKSYLDFGVINKFVQWNRMETLEYAARHARQKADVSHAHTKVNTTGRGTDLLASNIPKLFLVFYFLGTWVNK